MIQTMKNIKGIVVLNREIMRKLADDKRGQLGGTSQKFVNFIIGIAILFLVAAALVPVAQEAGNELNSSGLPLGQLFVAGGVVFILIAVALLNAAIKGPGK